MKLGANQRIVLNTGVIYLRLIVTMGISLFATRYVLEALGATEFGLYSVIAGVVTLFSFITVSLASSTQRFISYTMGETHDLNAVRKVFGSSITIHLFMAIAVAVVVMAGGWWLIYNVLKIPPGMERLAVIVLAYVCLGLIGSIVSVPFEAVLMAHENMVYVSVCSIVNSLVKFGGALILLYVDSNRLILYSIIMAALPFVLILMETPFCLLHYPESRIKWSDLKPSLKMLEFGKFTGWMLLGTAGMTLRMQGAAVLLNIFWGVIVNAANGIAVQVNNTLQFFSASITTSLRPQLVQSAGEGDRKRMHTLMFASSKYPLFLVSLAGCPLFAAMPYILSIWLKDVPDYTSAFCRILIINTILRQIYVGLVVGLEAQGRVKALNLILFFVFSSVIPAGWIMGKLGLNPNWVIWCIAISQAVMALWLLFVAGKELRFSKWEFVRDVWIRGFFVIAPLLAINILTWNVLTPNIGNFLLLISIDLVALCVLTLVIGFNAGERKSVLKILNRMRSRIHL